MTDFSILLSYIAIGFVGALFHYVKKRYIECMILDSLEQYLFGHFRSTLNAAWSIVASEVTLAVANTADPFTLAAVAGAFTAGYTIDSALNRDSFHKET